MQIWIIAFIFISNIFLSACATKQAKPPQEKISTQSTAVTQEPPIETITQLDPFIVEQPTPLPITKPQLQPATTKTPQITKKIVQPAVTSQPIATAPAPTLIAPITTTSWKPNEVHLIRGTELVNGLQLNLGRKPTITEMQQLLQSHMGLSAEQAQQIAISLSSN